MQEQPQKSIVHNSAAMPFKVVILTSQIL